VGEGDLARLAAGESIERASQQLIDLANQRGGPDNITVALVRIEERETAPRAPARTGGTAAVTPRAVVKRRKLQLLIVALVALTLALCGLAWVVSGMMRADPPGTAQTDSRAGEHDR
jgi:protein phosphatase